MMRDAAKREVNISQPQLSSPFSLTEDEKLLFFEFLQFIRQRRGGQPPALGIPLSVFNLRLSIQETIVKYLREELRYGYKTIAQILHRKPGPIGITYRNARRKMPERLDLSSQDSLPLDIFSDRLTTFESVVHHLKETRGCAFKDIAALLHRHYRAVWKEWNQAKAR